MCKHLEADYEIGLFGHFPGERLHLELWQVVRMSLKSRADLETTDPII